MGSEVHAESAEIIGVKCDYPSEESQKSIFCVQLELVLLGREENYRKKVSFGSRQFTRQEAKKFTEKLIDAMALTSIEELKNKAVWVYVNDDGRIIQIQSFYTGLSVANVPNGL